MFYIQFYLKNPSNQISTCGILRVGVGQSVKDAGKSRTQIVQITYFCGIGTEKAIPTPLHLCSWHITA